MCKFCSKSSEELEISNVRVWANHVRWCELRQNKEKFDAYRQKDSALKKELYTGRRIEVRRVCPECSKGYTTRQRGDGLNWWGKNILYEREYCSLSCANSRRDIPIESQERRRQKLSISMRQQWQNGIRHVDQNRYFSSKREREIQAYFQQQHPEDGWTHGRIGKNNPDMWSKKLKIIFEYDGIWHFVDIHDQLAKKQEQDWITEQWCIDNGWRLVRIDEDAKLGFREIENLIYGEQSPITKIGTRYKK